MKFCRNRIEWKIYEFMYLYIKIHIWTIVNFRSFCGACWKYVDVNLIIQGIL